MAKTKSTTGTVEQLDPKQMSKEQLGEKRKEITEYYEGNIPHLETQLKYEELLRDIEKTRAERLQAQMFIAQTMAPAPGSEEAPTSTNVETGIGAKGTGAPNAAQKGFDQVVKMNPNQDPRDMVNNLKKTLKRQSNDV